MRIDPADLSAPSALVGSTQADKMRHAAEQFEALFVSQMLRSVRESADDNASDDTGSDSTFLEVAEERLAQTMAARGGLGIATIVMKSLGKTA